MTQFQMSLLISYTRMNFQTYNIYLAINQQLHCPLFPCNIEAMACALTKLLLVSEGAGDNPLLVQCSLML